MEGPLSVPPAEKEDIPISDGYKFSASEKHRVLPVPEEGTHTFSRYHQRHFCPRLQQRKKTPLYFFRLQPVNLPPAHGITRYFRSKATRRSPMDTLSRAAADKSWFPAA